MSQKKAKRYKKYMHRQSNKIIKQFLEQLKNDNILRRLIIALHIIFGV